jgi:general stress protein 26
MSTAAEIADTTEIEENVGATEEPEKTTAEKREALTAIVKGARTALFVTEAGGALRGRPMANAHVDDNLEAIWFATRRDSGKIIEIVHEQSVLLGYVNSTGSEWASVCGSAVLVDDRAKVRELWSAFWKNWFDGPDDPNILLIRVRPETAEYWDSGSSVINMVKLAIAAVTGKQFDEGENERVTL